jgi:hypothetical protein
MDKKFSVMHWHGGTFSMPPGCRNLVNSGACKNRAFEYNARVEYIKFGWTTPGNLREMLSSQESRAAVTAITSEVGFFEYGSDAIIKNNLTAILEAGNRDIFFVGSATLKEGPTATLKRSNNMPTIPWSRDEFTALARSAGWELKTSEDGVFSWNVVLEPAAKD